MNLFFLFFSDSIVRPDLLPPNRTSVAARASQAESEFLTIIEALGLLSFVAFEFRADGNLPEFPRAAVNQF